MKQALLKTTMAALLATAFATGSFAQSATQPANQNTTGGPVVIDPAVPGTDDNAAADDRAAMNNSGNYLVKQSANQISANTYIGQAIYNGENNSIGDVNDLIIDKNGGVVAAVVGVGGFLGIGEKNVAVPMDKITTSQNAQDGTVRLTTTETVAGLEAAPEFQTLDMQASSMPVAPDTTATSSTTAK